LSLELFDVLGRTVRSEAPFEMEPGLYDYDLLRAGLPNGTYYFRLRENERVETRAVVFSR
jgi:hypothetical protein